MSPLAEASGNSQAGKLMEFWGRLLLGGLIVALVPTVAGRFGPGLAGVLVLLPVITILSFASLGLASGPASVERAVIGALIALPASAAYLGVTYIALRVGWAVGAALAVGFAGWLAIAIPLALLIARTGA